MDSGKSIARPKRFGEGVKLNIHAPTDDIPQLTDMPKLIWPWARVAMGSRNSYALKKCIRVGEDEIAKIDRAHHLLPRPAAAVDQHGGRIGLRQVEVGECMHAGDAREVDRVDDGFGAAMSRAVSSGAFTRISGDRLRRAFLEVLSEENRDVAIELLERLAVPSAVVEGWEIGAAAARSLAGGAGPDDAWRRLLAPAAPGLRERIATRLNFSRALRRITGSDA